VILLKVFDPTTAWWWPWLTAVVIPAVGAVGTIVISVVALRLAQMNSRTDRELRARERRVEFASQVRASVSPQILHAHLGSWLITEFATSEPDISELAEKADAPQAAELVAWMMMFLSSIEPADVSDLEKSTDNLIEETALFDLVLTRWVTDPSKKLDFDLARDRAKRAIVVERDIANKKAK